MPPACFLAALLLTAGLHWMLPVRILIDTPASFSGLLFIIVGFVLAVISARQFQAHATTIRPFEESDALVTGGIYRLTRNPMYLAMVVILPGVAILLGSVGAFLAIPSFVLFLQRRFIVNEEEMLAKKFGISCSEYRNTVRRWL